MNERDAEDLEMADAFSGGPAIRDLQARLSQAEAERDALKEALRRIAEWDDSVEAEDCPGLRAIARRALAADEGERAPDV